MAVLRATGADGDRFVAAVTGLVTQVLRTLGHQRGRAVSYEYYVGFWNDNDVEVGDVELVEANQDHVIVNVAMRWNDSATAATEEFTLRPGEDGALLIASQRTIDDG